MTAVFNMEHFEEVGRRLKVCRARMIPRGTDTEDAEMLHEIVDSIAMDLAQELTPGMPREAIIPWLASSGSPTAKKHLKENPQ